MKTSPLPPSIDVDPNELIETLAANLALADVTLPPFPPSRGASAASDSTTSVDRPAATPNRSVAPANG